MTMKPTYEELEQRVKELENVALERKRVEEALRESEERYHSLFENMLEGFAYYRMIFAEGWPQDLLYLDVNKAFKQLMGSEDVVGRKITEVVPGIMEANPELLEICGRVVLTGKPERFEDYFEPLKAWLFISVYSPEKGYCVAVFTNITERKQAEEALRRSEENFRHSLDDSPLGLRIVTARGETIYANRAILDIYGYDSLEELKSTPVEDRYTPESFAEHRIRKEKRKRGDDDPSEYEISIVRKDGEVRHLKVFRKEILWDGERQFQVLYNDITERKQAEEALKKSEALYREAQTATHIGHWELDPSIMTPTWSEEIFHIFGLDPEESEPSFPLHEKITHPDDWDILNTAVTTSIAEGTPFDIEFRIVCPDNAIRWMHARGYPRKDSQGRIERLFGTAQDITERKQAEEKTLASLREKEILLSEVHHRVKNNMQVISGLLDLQARLSGNPELSEILDETQRRIRSMALIHEKLYGSKDFARIDLAGYVRTLSQDLFQLYKINPGKIDLIIQTDGDVCVDINKAIPCGLILNELISNALKHAFPGDRQGELQIMIDDMKNTGIEIVVRDNGMGLPNDVDIHQPRSVGLYLVNGLATKQLDGQIEVRRGNGTEFQIKFPL
ncbi:MAG: hypothetical protein QG552_2277 [Thermodesulfobacteriota bacterium]|nr:hypothetical protein [Thermodesulfobacteriota bacterium]